jgi:hypothetical protein
MMNGWTDTFRGRRRDLCIGRFSSPYPNSKISIDNPLASKAGLKKLTKSEFCKLSSREKYVQLLLIKHIWQSQKFDKPSSYHVKVPVKNKGDSSHDGWPKDRRVSLVTPLDHGGLVGHGVRIGVANLETSGNTA